MCLTTKIYTQDYHAFGSVMAGRSFSNDNYRWGFNGKEKDNETFTDAYDFGARILDTRIGRWLAVDPLWAKYKSIYPYVFVNNMVISCFDKDGMDIYPTNLFKSSEYYERLIEIIDYKKIITNEDGSTTIHKLPFYEKYLKPYHTNNEKNVTLEFNNNLKERNKHAAAETVYDNNKIIFSKRNFSLIDFKKGETGDGGIESYGETIYPAKKISENGQFSIIIHEFIIHMAENGLTHTEVADNDLISAINCLYDVSNELSSEKLTKKQAIILTLGGLITSIPASSPDALKQKRTETLEKYNKVLMDRKIITEKISMEAVFGEGVSLYYDKTPVLVPASKASEHEGYENIPKEKVEDAIE